MSNEQSLFSERAQSSQEPSKLAYKIQNVLLKAMKSAETLIDAEIAQKLQQKMQQIANNGNSIADLVESFLYSLLGQIEQLSHAVSIDINRQDYEILQNAVQKSEAEIRKHIRIEQQLKIYMDGLEDRIEDYEKKIKIQQLKYMQLYESMRNLDTERKEALRRLAKFQEREKQREKDKRNNQKCFEVYRSKGSHVASKIITEQSIYKDYFVPKTKSRQSQVNSSSKEKSLIDKINERSKKLSEQKKNLTFMEECNIDVNIDPNQIQISKKSSMDYGPKQSSQLASKEEKRSKQYQSYQPSLREMTKTVQMKPQKRPTRKFVKNRTETSELQRKDNRSNSVCN